MKSKLVHDGEPRTWVVVFDRGDDPVQGLTQFAQEHDLRAAHFNAIGAFERATIRWFNWESKEYEPNRVDEQVEVVAFSGNVALKPDGSKKAHIHVVLGRRDGTALAGDLGEATVRPTLEVVVTEEPSHLQRRHDEASGLALIDV